MGETTFYKVGHIVVTKLILTVAVRPLVWLFVTSLLLGYIVDIFNTYQFSKFVGYALTKCNIYMLLQRSYSVKA
jgi:hypothetical protein